MTVEGFIAARAIPGSYDAEEFYNFIFEEVVSSLSRSYDVYSDVVVFI